MKVVIELDEINDSNLNEEYHRMAAVVWPFLERGFLIELSISKKTYQWFLDNRCEALPLPRTLFGYPFRVREETADEG